MGKKWCICFASLFSFLMVVFGGLTVFIDPYFHFHQPLKWFAYRIYNERYQNDGIVKHFDYDAMITGSSMVQNFKTSEMDRLFGTNAIKVPYSGATYKEISDNLARAMKVNPNMKMVIWGLDYFYFYRDYNLMKFDSYPTYLYDDNPFNDVNYYFNKSVLINGVYWGVLDWTQKGKHTTSFDEYNNWNARFTYGKEEVFKRVTRSVQAEEFRRTIPSYFNPENIEINVLSLVRAHPDTEFYLFWPPFSIVLFDGYSQAGELHNVLAWEKEALKLMLPYNNVHFFSFFDDFSLITNLGNYKDAEHYHQGINSYILKCLATGQHQITIENYEDYCQRMWDFYTTYDYDAIYK